jgi:diguanylate cyclase (GGDEF)-like protein
VSLAPAPRLPSGPPRPPRRRRALSHRLAALARWSDADKCLLVAGVTLLFAVCWGLRMEAVRDTPALAPHLNQVHLPWLLRMQWLEVAVLGAISAACLVLRREPSRPRPVLVYTTLQVWYAFQAYSLWTFGSYTTPFSIVSLTFSLLMMLIHSLRPAAWGLATFSALVMGATLLEWQGVLPYAPVLADMPRPPMRFLVGMTGISFFTTGGLLYFFAQVVGDWREREQALAEASATDELTRTANRRQMMREAEALLAEARATGRPFSVVLVDVDHFKRVNDAHGHLVGDRVLVAVAEALRQEVRGKDTVARFGGEEFALLLRDTGPEGAEAVAERCRLRVAATRTPALATPSVGPLPAAAFLEGAPGGDVRVTVSLGVASAPRADAPRVEDLLRLADEALYRAKAGGRNRVLPAA